MTLENTEKPKCGSDEECLGIIEKLEAEERPLDVTGHGADPKCRYVSVVFDHLGRLDGLAIQLLPPDVRSSAIQIRFPDIERAECHTENLRW